MKILFKAISILLLFTLLFSCSNNEVPTVKKMATIFETPIGSFENGTFNFIVPKASILETFKEIDAIKEAGINPVELQVEMINNKPYLRIYGDDQSISTIALVQPPNSNARKLNALVTGGVLCTSVDCASGGGCIPERGGCSNCVTGSNPSGTPIYGDCKTTHK